MWRLIYADHQVDYMYHYRALTVSLKQRYDIVIWYIICRSYRVMIVHYFITSYVHWSSYYCGDFFPRNYDMIVTAVPYYIMPWLCIYSIPLYTWLLRSFPLIFKFDWLLRVEICVWYKYSLSVHANIINNNRLNHYIYI